MNEHIPAQPAPTEGWQQKSWVCPVYEEVNATSYGSYIRFNLQ